MLTSINVKFIFDSACLGDKGLFSSVNIVQKMGCRSSSCVLGVLAMFLVNSS